MCNILLKLKTVNQSAYKIMKFSYVFMALILRETGGQVEDQSRWVIYSHRSSALCLSSLCLYFLRLNASGTHWSNT